MHTIALSQKRTENKKLPYGRTFLSMRKTKLTISEAKKAAKGWRA